MYSTSDNTNFSYQIVLKSGNARRVSRALQAFAKSGKPIPAGLHNAKRISLKERQYLELPPETPDALLPAQLAKNCEQRIRQWFMDQGESVAVEIKAQIYFDHAWHDAPTEDTLITPAYAPVATDPESVRAKHRKDDEPGAESVEKDEEEEDEEEEEEEEEEEYQGIECPHCGARDEDTTFHALMMVTENRRRTVHESREVRAWVEIRSVDENGNADTYSSIEEVYDDDEYEEFEEYDSDVDGEDYEVGSSEGTLYCTSCDSEFDAPGDVT